MTLENELISVSAFSLVVGIIFIVLGVYSLPTRTESVFIGYTKVEKIKNVRNVTATYKGQEKVLNVYVKEGNNVEEIFDEQKKLIKIEYNPNNDKDFDTFSGPPDYVGGGLLIFFGSMMCLNGLNNLWEYVVQKKREKK
jgi:hypothetical protein